MCCSCCGRLCAECKLKDEYGCDGCKNMIDGYWGGKCEIKECCTEKKFTHCGECAEFPCGLLREFCYDEDNGDDGDSLLNCKKWADEKRVGREVKVKNILLGLSVGGAVGVTIGELQGMTAAWLVGGLAVGGGIAVMVEINKKK